MIKVGQRYKPFSARLVNGGSLTQFSIPQGHKDKEGGYHQDGFINVLCKGQYPFYKGNGDQIEIKSISGVSVYKANGNQYVGVVADIDYISAKAVSLAKEDGGSWDDDIPEELL